MTINRFDPIEEMRPLPVAPFADLSEEIGAEAPLAYDVYRSGDVLCIDFDVPGVDPSAIHLTLENQYLDVAVTKELPERNIEMIERGRVHGVFKRRLVFPNQWRIAELSATVEQGVLHLQAPLGAAQTRRKITVEAINSAAPTSKVQPGRPVRPLATVGVGSTESE